jgi:DNA-binding transcriptional LysR family regulator
MHGTSLGRWVLAAAPVAMHLTRLRYFVVAAEEGSVVGAARRLRVAQPALSRQLTALEREVGTPLFERHARGVRLLPAGVAFLEHARRLLAEGDSGLLAARSAARPSAGARLRLASPDWPVRAAWVARAVSRLYALHPEVEVEHEATLWLQHETAVRNGSIDVGFAVAMLLASGHRARIEVVLLLRDPPIRIDPEPVRHAQRRLGNR